jgi:hypothetical protein
MKAKTINKVLNSKFQDWLKSIKKEEVKKLVEANTIITGGCIASMLLKEEVNDFDIYFTNKETVLAVARYYVDELIRLGNNKFKDSNNNVLIEVIDCDNSSHSCGIGHQTGRVKIHIKSAGIAGAQTNGDYQYFESRPPEEGEDYVESIVNEVTKLDNKKIDDTKSKEKYRPVFASANAITLSDKIQIVLRFYGEQDKIHQHYDYIHCTNYWTSADKEVVLHAKALESALSKELIYVGSKYPVCSVIRTRKFLKRGWTINAGQYLKMCFQISKLDLSNIEILEDQLIGVDAAYFGQLIDLMKERQEKDKDSKVDYGYLASIIDKIF